MQIIREYPLPKNLKALRGFLGIINYYKRFVPQIASKSELLYQLLRKGVKFKWDQMKINAFEDIRLAFYENLLLVLPDFNKEFILKVDASQTTISSVLVQRDGPVEEPICFISRILKKHELNYGVGEMVSPPVGG